MQNEPFKLKLRFTAGAAMVAAILYAARAVQALADGELDHMAHGISSGQPLVIGAALAMAAALLGLRSWALPPSQPCASRISIALALASVGLLWIGTTRFIELLGTPGPWGLYGGPGLVTFLGGVLVAGLMLRARDQVSGSTGLLGPVLVAIALLRAAAGGVSMTLFNVLGRNVGANTAATQAGQAVRLLEALCWLALAVLVARTSPHARSSAEAQRSNRSGAIRSPGTAS